MATLSNTPLIIQSIISRDAMNSNTQTYINQPAEAVNPFPTMVPQTQHQLSQSMVLTSSRSSLIDNSLAQSFTMKRARASAAANNMLRHSFTSLAKSKSDSSMVVVHNHHSNAKFSYRNRTPGSIGNTVRIVGGSGSSSPSSSSADLTEAANIEDMDPYTYIESVLVVQDENDSQCSDSPAKQPAMQALHEDDFEVPTEAQIAAYANDAILAVRTSDVEALRSIVEQGRSLNCCNRFGESLLHVACRRSTPEVVRFLLDEANVSPRIKDDYGRTPLHDACWRGSPEYEVVNMLLEKESKLAFVKDVRGHRPFQYARREHWGGWREFLRVKRDLILS